LLRPLTELTFTTRQAPHAIVIGLFNEMSMVQINSKGLKKKTKKPKKTGKVNDS
jgi:hypothetical protein